MSVDINAFNKSFRQEEQIDPKIYDFIMETNRCSLSLDYDEFGGEPTFKKFMNITENGQKLINYVKKIYQHEEFDLLKYFYDMQVIELDESSGIEIGPEKIRCAEKNFIQQHVEYIEACYNSIKCSFKLFRSLRKIVSKQKLKLILDLLFDYISGYDHCPFGEYTLSKKPKRVEIQFKDPSILKTPMFCESYKYSLKRKAQNSPYLPNNSTDGDYYLWGNSILCTLQEQIHSVINEHEEQYKTQLVVHKGVHYSEWSECKCCGKKIYTEYMTYYKCCDCYYCPICLLDRLIPFYEYKIDDNKSESDESEDGKIIVNDPFNYVMTLRQCPVCKKDQGCILYFEIDGKATPPEYFKRQEQQYYTESSSDSE